MKLLRELSSNQRKLFLKTLMDVKHANGPALAWARKLLKQGHG